VAHHAPVAGTYVVVITDVAEHVGEVVGVVPRMQV